MGIGVWTMEKLCGVSVCTYVVKVHKCRKPFSSVYFSGCQHQHPNAANRNSIRPLVDGQSRCGQRIWYINSIKRPCLFANQLLAAVAKVWGYGGADSVSAFLLPSFGSSRSARTLHSLSSGRPCLHPRCHQLDNPQSAIELQIYMGD